MHLLSRAALTAAIAVPVGIVMLAADHAEAPGTEMDPAADIADLYAWHAGESLTIAFTFAGLQAPSAGQSGTYDPDVLYTVHLDRDGDAVSDHDIHFRFGSDPEVGFGIQAEGLPGTDAALVGAVETTITGANGVRLFAGLRDDPFFFDLQGFEETLATSTLQFDNTRDSLAGTNITAVVFEVPLAAATAGSDNLQIWITTARLTMPAPTGIAKR